jgi:hypothetical protein
MNQANSAHARALAPRQSWVVYWNGVQAMPHGWQGNTADKRLDFDFGSAWQLIRGIALLSVGNKWFWFRPQARQAQPDRCRLERSRLFGRLARNSTVTTHLAERE